MTLVQTELKKTYLGPNVSAMQGPAPTGYHVPSKDENVALVAAMTALGMDTSNGNCMKTYLKMPFAGCRRSSSSIYNQGETGYYWSATAAGAHYARVMLFYSEDLYPQLGDCRSFGYSIRCFKNTPAIPDNNWTTLFDGSGIATNAGIFHNTTSGLISISSDGQNRITIQDKNLGASTVYNDGDTLSEANCGKYFQWGNNYGFAFTGSITTSSTKVDASNYGPGNYYSSSTFITTDITDWSSVQNDNLWGGQYTPIKRVTIRPNGQEKQIRPVGRLPSAYQEVEYIQSSGTQLIDTGYLVTPNTEVAVDYQFINANSQDFVFGIGSDGITSSGVTFCVYIGDTSGGDKFKAGISDGTNNNTWRNYFLLMDTNRHTFVLNNGHSEIYNTSGTLEGSINTIETITRTAVHSFGLFCWWRTDLGTPARSNITAAKLYGCKIKESGTLQKNFIPCYRKADGEIGLYDLVNDQFYTNVGTGTFTKGPDVNGIQTLNNSLNNSLNNTFTPTITPDIPDTPGSGTGDILTI